jgi:hypothetical protein
MNFTPPTTGLDKALAPLGKSLSTSLGLGSGAAAGITLGLALPITLGLSLLAAHDKRVKQAKDENQALGIAVETFQSDIKQVFDMANRGGISASDAQNALAAMHDSFWSYMKQFQMASTPCPPGIDDVQNGCWYTFRQTKTGNCGKACTAGCCVGCNVIVPVIQRAIAVFQNGGGSVHVCEIPGNKFGFVNHPGYDLAYTPPPIADTVEQAIENLLNGGSNSSTVAGKAANKTIMKYLIGAGAIFALIIFAALLRK